MSASIEKKRRPKHEAAADLFEERIRAGVYGIRGIPGERRLATELGVSYMSARRVVIELVNRRVLRRSPNGRLLPGVTVGGKQGLRVGFVMPAFTSQTFLEIQYELSQLVAETGGVVRAITYTSPSDPLIFEALEGDFDGLFFILPIGAPKLLIDQLARHRDRVVALWYDLAHLGIPSIVTLPPRFVGKALDHLLDLGHRRIDCFNTLPHDVVVADRIRQWRMGLEQRGIVGELHDEPTEAFQCSVTGAYRTFKAMIERGLHSRAYLCTTAELGRGAIRACHEAGLRVGQDISICGFSELSAAKLMVPSLTTVAEADSKPYLAMGLEWIETRGENWQRPLRLEPDDVKLFLGESTGPCGA